MDLKAKLTEIDVRCMDLQRGRNPDGSFNDSEVYDAGKWDATVVPWGGSQVNDGFLRVRGRLGGLG